MSNKEIGNWEKSEQMIAKAEKIKVSVIKNLLVEGYTFGEIAKMLNKNSRQSVFQFYREHSLKAKVTPQVQ